MAKLCIIGGGAMGAAFAKGVISSGVLQPDQVTIADVDEARLQTLARDLRVKVVTDNTACAKDADVVLLAVKPPLVRRIAEQLAPLLTSEQLVISIAAGVLLDKIEALLPEGVGVIRAMPNTPCQIGAGAIGYSLGKSVSKGQAAVAKRIFDAVGVSYEVPERLLNAVTGLSGSGPAYIFYVVEAMIEAGVLLGLPRSLSNELVVQTLVGAATMLRETGEHPTVLRENVSSPAGTTVAAIRQLDDHKVRAAFVTAMEAARDRSQQLAGGT